MDDVKEYYDKNVYQEYLRLEKNFIEQFIVKSFMDKYIKTNYSVLDIGGGPGRYSIYLAKKGMNICLMDISGNCINFAQKIAFKEQIHIETIVADCRQIKNKVNKKYDCILLMGPIYHIIDEFERIELIKNCIDSLNPNGLLYVSFISSYSRILWALREQPIEIQCSDLLKNDLEKSIKKTEVFRNYPAKFMTPPHKISSFMEQFKNLRMLELVGCESILLPFAEKLQKQSPEIIELWMNYALSICTHKEFLAFSEHILYIGEKNEL